MNQRVHHAVLEPDRVLGTPIPIHFRVKVVTIQALRAAVVEVADVPGQVEMRDQYQQLHHGWVQPGSWNDVEPPIAGKRRAARAVRAAGIGIEDHPLAELCGATLGSGHHNGVAPGIHDGRSQFSAEIARAEIFRRDGKEPGAAYALKGAFPVREKEQLAFLDGSTDAAPINITDAFGLSGYVGAILIPPKRT